MVCWPSVGGGDPGVLGLLTAGGGELAEHADKQKEKLAVGCGQHVVPSGQVQIVLPHR